MVSWTVPCIGQPLALESPLHWSVPGIGQSFALVSPIALNCPFLDSLLDCLLDGILDHVLDNPFDSPVVCIVSYRPDPPKSQFQQGLVFSPPQQWRFHTISLYSQHIQVFCVGSAPRNEKCLYNLGKVLVGLTLHQH